MEEIKQWLQGSKDYDSGVRLYAKYGKFQSVLQLLRKQRLHDKLQDALRETLRDFKAQVQQRSLPQTPATETLKPNAKLQKPIHKPSPHNPQLESLNEDRKSDAIYQSIEKKWKQLYAEFATIHARLVLKVEEDPDNTETISALAKELYRMRMQLVQLWHQRDHFMAYGVLPDAPLKAKKIKSNITQSAMQQLLSVRSNVSIKKRELKKLEEKLLQTPGDANLKAKRDAKEQQLRELINLKTKLENGKD